MNKGKNSKKGFLMLLALALLCSNVVTTKLAGANPIPAPPITQIYIRSDGTVDPSTTPIQRTENVYTLKSDLTNSTIEIQKDNVMLDGKGFTLLGNGEGWNTGITLASIHNVIIKNMEVRNFWKSIVVIASSNVIILNNRMLTSWNIILDSSISNQIIGNDMVGQYTGYGYCIQVQNGSFNNLIVGNNLSYAGAAVWMGNGKNNTFYHNNFINNSNNVVVGEGGNLWDNGKEGNFWNDYNVIDADSNGIGDIPYVVFKSCQDKDRYPLRSPFDIDNETVELPDWANAALVRPDFVPFPTLPVVAISGALAAFVITSGLLVYRRKRKSEAIKS